jgi:hypothetical protein
MPTLAVPHEPFPRCRACGGAIYQTKGSFGWRRMHARTRALPSLSAPTISTNHPRSLTPFPLRPPSRERAPSAATAPPALPETESRRTYSADMPPILLATDNPPTQIDASMPLPPLPLHIPLPAPPPFPSLLGAYSWSRHAMPVGYGRLHPGLCLGLRFFLRLRPCLCRCRKPMGWRNGRRKGWPD